MHTSLTQVEHGMSSNTTDVIKFRRFTSLGTTITLGYDHHSELNPRDKLYDPIMIVGRTKVMLPRTDPERIETVIAGEKVYVTFPFMGLWYEIVISEDSVGEPNPICTISSQFERVLSFRWQGKNCRIEIGEEQSFFTTGEDAQEEETSLIDGVIAFVTSSPNEQSFVWLVDREYYSGNNAELYHEIPHGELVWNRKTVILCGYFVAQQYDVQWRNNIPVVSAGILRYDDLCTEQARRCIVTPFETLWINDGMRAFEVTLDGNNKIAAFVVFQDNEYILLNPAGKELDRGPELQCLDLNDGTLDYYKNDGRQWTHERYPLSGHVVAS